MMNKYNVVIHYEGAWNFDIEAKDEDEAMEIAETKFAELSSEELIDNLADSFVDGCWELKG